MANIVGNIQRIPSGLVSFAKEAYAELKKVSWPSRQTTVRYTMIVVISSLVVGLVIGGFDYLLTLGVEQYIIK